MGINYDIFTLKLFFNYSYIVVDKATKTALIVDPAWQLNQIIQKLNELEADLKGIVLTHSHYDHVNLVHPLVKRFDTNVYMSKMEIDYYGFRCENLVGLQDLDEFSVGKTSVVSLFTPGHTAGGMCYLLPDSIFTGDTVFIEGCGLCSFDGGSPDQMFDSVQKIKSITGPDIRVFPGHSYGKPPGTMMHQLIRENIYFHFDDKQDFINFRMRKKQRGLFNFK